MSTPGRACASLVLAGLLAACATGHGDGYGSEAEMHEGGALPMPAPAGTPVRIAFMPDIHFHDVYAEFEDGSFPGVRNPRNGRSATIRTMQAQLTSTRLFNENHFAFIAALDDAVARGVKLIALPGDFSDDGQPVHMRGLARLLDEYAARHGVEFFAAPGNHDPVRPFEQAGGKDDYLGRDPITGDTGYPQPVFSRGGNDDCSTPYPGEWARVGDSYCTQEVLHMGYAGITRVLAQHGFVPKPQYLYYETPYSTYSYDDYDYPTALEQSGWANRQYEICGVVCKTIPDTSYVVEPVEGLWLVGLDANVYVPTGPGPNDFTGSGNQGYNAMLRHKPHVIEWLRSVVARGASRGKQVVAFSHFPMAEFYNGASDDIAEFLGADAMQLRRRPAEGTTRALADTGLKIHVGGHMHFNDMAVRDYGGGTALFNIQAPSLAAYVPAYKLMTLDGSDRIEVETVRLDDVPRFDELFDLYRAEHAYGDAPWALSILDATSYGDFTHRYIAELVRMRLLDDHWHCDIRELVKSPLTGADLLVLSQLRTDVTLKALAGSSSRGGVSAAFFDCLSDAGGSAGATTSVDRAFASDLAAAEASVRALVRAHGMRLEDFAQWRAIELIGDFVRLANAGDLALADIGAVRQAQYRLLARALEASDTRLVMDGERLTDANTLGDVVQARFKPVMSILVKLAAGAPSEHVLLDLESDELIDLSGERAEQPAPYDPRRENASRTLTR